MSELLISKGTPFRSKEIEAFMSAAKVRYDANPPAQDFTRMLSCAIFFVKIKLVTCSRVQLHVLFHLRKSKEILLGIALRQALRQGSAMHSTLKTFSDSDILRLKHTGRPYAGKVHLEIFFVVDIL